MRATSAARGLSSTLTSLAAACLHVPAAMIARDVPLARYGMDSLAAVELTTAIESALGRRLPDSLLSEHPDLASLERFLTAVPDEGVPTADDREQMRSDSVLPPDVRPAEPDGRSGSRGAVLLTGATGFLGGHLLRSLLRNTRATVHCLARGADRSSVAAKIRRSMETYRIWDPAFAPRVQIIVGDIALPHLGLGRERFAALCEEVDAVYHSAAVVDWVRSYGALRKANVLGTLELLRLACAARPKPFHFVSTAAVCYSTWGSREVSETDDVHPYLHGLHLGYAHSKCVAEALVRQAGERGLPATIHRPSLITGSRASAVSNADDLLSRLFRGMIEMGVAPDLDWSLDCCPVDYVADAIVHLAAGRCPSSVFHLVNPSPRHWRELVLWMNLFGYRVHLLPYREWLGLLHDAASAPGHPLRGLLPFFSRQPEGEGGLTLPELYEDTRRSRIRSDRTKDALRSGSIGSASVNAGLLDRYFLDYIEKGVLPRVGAGRRRGSSDGKKPLDVRLFSIMLRRSLRDRKLEVSRASVVEDGSSHSIISELSSWKHGSAAGLDRYRLHLSGAAGMAESMDVVVKRKAKDDHVIDVARRIACLCSPGLGRAFARSSHRVGLTGCHRREIGIYGQKDERFQRHTPRVYGLLQNDEREEWALVLEDISGLELLDTAEDPSAWRQESIEASIRGLANLHAIWFGREKELLMQPWLGPVISARQRAGMHDLWTALAEHARTRFAQSIGGSVKRLQSRLIRQTGPRWRVLERLPRTLVHNDFNPRNIALRRQGEDLRLCAYDWELATVGVPQRDLAELLCFTLKPELDHAEVHHYLDFHRAELERAVNRPVDPLNWASGFRLSLPDLLTDRFAMYAMIDRFRPQRFLRRVVSTWHALYEVFPSGKDGI